MAEPTPILYPGGNIPLYHRRRYRDGAISTVIFSIASLAIGLILSLLIVKGTTAITGFAIGYSLLALVLFIASLYLYKQSQLGRHAIRREEIDFVTRLETDAGAAALSHFNDLEYLRLLYVINHIFYTTQGELKGRALPLNIVRCLRTKEKYLELSKVASVCDALVSSIRAYRAHVAAAGEGNL
jgi:hypothetical protein